MRNRMKADRVGEIFPGGSARDQARHGNRITADIKNSSAGKVVVVHAAARVEAGVIAEGRLDDADIADGALADDVDEPLRLRMAAIHEGFHEKDAVDVG